MCFLQYYEVLGNKKLAIDNVDRAPNGIRSKWQRTSGDHGKSDSSKRFDLIPIGSKHVIVCIINSDTEIVIIEKICE